MIDYTKKYIKYKLKYLNLLKEQNGGIFGLFEAKSQLIKQVKHDEL